MKHGVERASAVCLQVLLSPFTSVLEMMQIKLWPLSMLLPLRLLCTDTFDNLRKAPRVTIPTRIIHGRQDAMVPPTMGVAMGDAIPNAQTCLVGGGHNDLFDSENIRGVVELIVEFAKGHADTAQAIV